MENVLRITGAENIGMITTGYDSKLELRYNDFIPILIKAIRQQQKTIEDLRIKLDMIQQELQNLEKIKQTK